MALMLRGEPVAATISGKLQEKVLRMSGTGVIPTLAIVRIGQQIADVSYETAAMKRCARIGIRTKRVLLPETTSKEELVDVIRGINEDNSVHGCLLLRPLPSKELEDAVSSLLLPEKDVDGITPRSWSGLFAGHGIGYPPCTAQACLEVLDYYGVPLQGKRVTVVGRSLVVGKPLSMMLQNRDATVTMCHSRTINLFNECRKAEVIVAAVGKKKLINRSYIRSNQVVIDVGINEDENGRLCGDVDFDEIQPIVSAITPVPGGIGAVTTSVLCKHVIDAAEQQSKQHIGESEY